MKKYLRLKKFIYIVLICITVSMLQGCTSVLLINGEGISNNLSKLQKDRESVNKVRTLNYDEVKNSLIRFHVIANSDSEEDQNLKLKVKNRVIDYLYPYLNESDSLDESREIIKDKMEDVKKISEEVILENNYTYNVQVEISRENFPDKSYGNITLPQGNYEAFRIIIGDGEGKNWWCVMFPPLCFVDESKAEVEYDKTEEKINSKQSELNSEAEINFNKNKSEKLQDSDKEDSENNVQVKFKVLEIFKELFN